MTTAVSIAVVHRPDPISKSIAERVATAWEDSLQSDNITDTKVDTYSKRRGYQKTSHPRALVVIDSYKRSGPVALYLRQAAPKDMTTDRYDYGSDGDLEDE